MLRLEARLRELVTRLPIRIVEDFPRGVRARVSFQELLRRYEMSTRQVVELFPEIFAIRQVDGQVLVVLDTLRARRVKRITLGMHFNRVESCPLNQITTYERVLSRHARNVTRRSKSPMTKPC